MPRSAEQIGVSLPVLKAAVNAVLKERAERVAAERLQQDREHKRKDKQRTVEEREQQRSKRLAEKQAEQEKRHAEKEAERAKRKAEKEAERKAKEKANGFTTLARLPVARHAKQLERLAEQLGEDVAVLRKRVRGFPWYRRR